MSCWTYIDGELEFTDCDIKNIEFKCLKEKIRKHLGLISVCIHKNDDFLVNELELSNGINRGNLTEYIGNKLPCGSEGSLQYKIVRYQSSRYFVFFWGGLRDYNNKDEVVEYFQSLTKNFDGICLTSGEFSVQWCPLEDGDYKIENYFLDTNTEMFKTS